MFSLSKFKNILSKNKYGKYLAIGGFAFFFIKGLIWLAVIFSVGFSAFNLIKISVHFAFDIP